MFGVLVVVCCWDEEDEEDIVAGGVVVVVVFTLIMVDVGNTSDSIFLGEEQTDDTLVGDDSIVIGDKAEEVATILNSLARCCWALDGRFRVRRGLLPPLFEDDCDDCSSLSSSMAVKLTAAIKAGCSLRLSIPYPWQLLMVVVEWAPGGGMVMNVNGNGIWYPCLIDA
mmetsp:Transcript_22244/g.48325  ORF Transcript_22244/g.48325 Transcript_22244/m.48325 type:complete len:168 (+) Transcript_22244:1415-1918(+)